MDNEKPTTSLENADLLENTKSIEELQNHKLPCDRNKKKATLPQETDDYSASGVKNTLHGVIYQLKVLMLVAKHCQEKEFSFRLATEMNAAEKFDDLVLFYNKPGNVDEIWSISLQAKHIEVENESKIAINEKDLLKETEDRFSLQKYFVSYQKIREKKLFENGKYFIYTNIGFHFDENVDIKGVKKLSSLYFKPVTNKEDLMPFGDETYNGHFYQLTQLCSENEPIENKLKELFDRTSECKKLAKLLVQHFLSGEVIKLEGLFKLYQQALVWYVIDVKSGIMKENFFKNKNRHIQNFREMMQELIENAADEIDGKIKAEELTEREKQLLKILKPLKKKGWET